MLKKLVVILAVLLCLCAQNVYAKTYLETVYEDYYQILEEENKPQGDDYITRGEFVALLMNSFEYTSELYLCTFYDIYEYEWDYKYIATAQNKGIALGDAGNDFNSDTYLKTQDAIVFLSRAHRLDKISMGEYILEEGIGVSEYARDFVGYAINEGIYPKNESGYYKGNDKISVKAALDLMNKYDELSELGFGAVKFIKGYPETQISGRSSSVLINLITKWFLIFTVFSETDAFQLQLSVIISWIIAVIFAYLMNRFYVFNSDNKKVFFEFISFLISRILTLFTEMILMWLLIIILKLDNLIILLTIIIQIVIIVLNYIFSKIFVFK